LPPEEKAEIMSQKAFKKVLFWGFSSLIFVLIFLALLSSIWWYLLIQLKSIQGIVDGLESSPQNEAFKELKQEIDGVNQKLQYFNQLQRQETEYSFYVEKLTELTTQDIKFKRIWIDGNKFVLEGTAITRQALLSFKDALGDSPYFKNLDTPLSNFLKQNNIDFSFAFELKTQ